MSWRTWLDRLLGTAPETADVLDAAAHVPHGMSRRSFLRGALAATAVAATVDVEQLLWTPGEKTIFLPEFVDVDVYNGLVTPDWVARQALRLLNKNLRIASQFCRPCARIGDTVQVHLPQTFQPRPGISTIYTPAIAVTFDQMRWCEIVLPTPADQQNPARYIKREVEPQMKQMARRLEIAGVDVYADLELPRGIEQAHTVRQDGVSLRVMKGFDVTEGRVRMRVDVLGGSSKR